MLPPWFRHARSALIAVGVLSGSSGWFLRILRSTDEERRAADQTAVACTLKVTGDPLCQAAMIDHLPGAADACVGKRASDGCDLALPPVTISGECAPGPGRSLFCAPRSPAATKIPPEEKEDRAQSTIRW